MIRSVVINGMFRSGTTLLWRILAADDSFSNFLCEPLHPELPTHIQNDNHYRHYNRFDEAMKKWSSAFHRNKLRLSRGDVYEELGIYLMYLIKSGSLVKFCRMNLRLAWFLEKFPNTIVINIIRDPRAVCYSFLKTCEKPIDSPDIDWSSWYGSEYFKLYSQLDKWGPYIRDLEQEVPYIKIFALWRVNVEQSISDLAGCNNSNWLNLKYEELVLHPEVVMQKIYAFLGKKPPRKVMDSACGRDACDLGGYNKWQKMTSKEWVSEWEKVPLNIWEKGIQISRISKTMKALDYD